MAMIEKTFAVFSLLETFVMVKFDIPGQGAVEMPEKKKAKLVRTVDRFLRYFFISIFDLSDLVVIH